ncbi:MAG: hypothetical protein AMXMBFR53_26440 [Gemmatimonadota bacterium]
MTANVRFRSKDRIAIRKSAASSLHQGGRSALSVHFISSHSRKEGRIEAVQLPLLAAFQVTFKVAGVPFQRGAERSDAPSERYAPKGRAPHGA